MPGLVTSYEPRPGNRMSLVWKEQISQEERARIKEANKSKENI